MQSKPELWIRQAELDMQMARDAARVGRYEWACFGCQQAGEKALKSILYTLGRTTEVHTHSLTDLVRSCTRLDQTFKQLGQPAKDLDSHYLQSRYPGALNASAAPGEVYGETEFHRAEQCVESILTACRSFLGGSSGSSKK